MPKGKKNITNASKTRRLSRAYTTNVAGMFDRSKYATALFEPFSRAAIGAQIPDYYCAPTATYHIKSRFTVSTNSSGVADVVIMPNAHCNAVIPVGSADGAATLRTRTGTVFGTGLMYTDPAILAGKLANYRIVAMGVRVKSIASMTDAKGSVIVAVVPSESITPEQLDTVGGVTPATDASATLAAWYDSMGIPYNGTGDAATLSAGGLDNLPVATSTTMLRLAERPMEIHPKPISAYNTRFRSSRDRQYGFDTVNQPSGAIDCGDGSYLRVDGMETVALKVHGGAVSTALLEVEVIYHLEGTPAAGVTSATQVAGGSGTPSVNMSMFNKTLDMLARAPSFLEQWTGGVLKAMSNIGSVTKTAGLLTQGYV